MSAEKPRTPRSWRAAWIFLRWSAHARAASWCARTTGSLLTAMLAWLSSILHRLFWPNTASKNASSNSSAGASRDYSIPPPLPWTVKKSNCWPISKCPRTPKWRLNRVRWVWAYFAVSFYLWGAVATCRMKKSNLPPTSAPCRLCTGCRSPYVLSMWAPISLLMRVCTTPRTSTPH